MTASTTKMRKPPSHLFVVRHGNRLDAADKRWHLTSPTPYDPPLTYSGFLQTRQVGNQIGKILEQVKIDEEISTKARGLKGKRRRFNVIIHSSPFLRCVQTSVGISSGLAQSSPDSKYSPADVMVLRPTAVTQLPNQPKPVKSVLLRLDSFLGEWLSPEYFEAITPPPGPALMLGGAKADLLRREDYSAYTDFAPREQTPSSVSSLWNGSPTMQPQRPKQSVSSELDDSLNVSILGTALPAYDSSEKSYLPPRPMYAVSGSGKIPEGFVAHARDACVDVDYQWDSMRPPLDFGDGGKLPEEWTSMHKRFRRGLRKLVRWYSTNDSSTVTATPNDHTVNGKAEEGEQHEEEDDVETVIIIVSHGAGCNALIGAITHQPVLMDVGIASITMAARKPGLEYPQALTSPDMHDPSSKSTLRVDQMYDIRLSATTEHLQPTMSTPISARTSSMASALNGVGLRGRTSTVSDMGGPVMSPFTFTEPFSSSGSRSTSASATAGNGHAARRASEAQKLVRPSALSLVGFSDFEGGSSPQSASSGGNTPTTSLWSIAPSTLRLLDDGSGEDDAVDYNAMLPNFDQGRFREADNKAAGSIEPSPPAAPVFPNLKATSTAPTMEPYPAHGIPKTPIFAGPIRIQTDLGPDMPVEEVPIRQLGGGAGGLWGLPPPPGEAERFRDLHHTKRRWTVNERA